MGWASSGVARRGRRRSQPAGDRPHRRRRVQHGLERPRDGRRVRPPRDLGDPEQLRTRYRAQRALTRPTSASIRGSPSCGATPVSRTTPTTCMLAEANGARGEVVGAIPRVRAGSRPGDRERAPVRHRRPDRSDRPDLLHEGHRPRVPGQVGRELSRPMALLRMPRAESSRRGADAARPSHRPEACPRGVTCFGTP